MLDTGLVANNNLFDCMGVRPKTKKKKKNEKQKVVKYDCDFGELFH